MLGLIGGLVRASFVVSCSQEHVWRTSKAKAAIREGWWNTACFARTRAKLEWEGSGVVRGQPKKESKRA